MTTPVPCHLAIDLGASTGRVIMGRIHPDGLTIQQVHRFSHQPRQKHGHLRWDFTALLEGVRTGLALGADAAGSDPIASVSCDSWAQDFGLLDRDGQLLADPISYRDPQTHDLPEAFSHIITPTDLLRRTGSAAAHLTTLCQLYAMTRRGDNNLTRAGVLLHMADLIHYFLCGRACTDWTMATAGQMRNLSTGQWDHDLLETLGINPAILPPIIETPAVIGTITADTAPHDKLIGVPVVSGVHHDTAAATAAVKPLTNNEFFFSAGTYGMLGCLIDTPALPDHNTTDFSLLGVADHRWALWTTVPGLWALQQCRNQWSDRGITLSHDRLDTLIDTADITSTIDLNDLQCTTGTDILTAITTACARSGQRAPETPGQFAAVIINSLSHAIADGIARLQQTTGQTCHTLRIVSGGAGMASLCRRIARTAAVDVLAGPTEATAMGNCITQARTMATIDAAVSHHDLLHNLQPLTHYKASS